MHPKIQQTGDEKRCHTPAFAHPSSIYNLLPSQSHIPKDSHKSLRLHSAPRSASRKPSQSTQRTLQLTLSAPLSVTLTDNAVVATAYSG